MTIHEKNTSAATFSIFADPTHLQTLAEEVFEPFDRGPENISDFVVAVDDYRREQNEERRQERLHFLQARLLSAIDASVDQGAISTDEANLFWDRLGLSSAERSRIRGPSA